MKPVMDRELFVLLIKPLLMYATLLFLVPLLGAWFVWNGLSWVGILDYPYAKCMRAYLLGSTAAVAITLLLSLLLKRLELSPDLFRVILLSAYTGVHLVVVPLLLRVSSVRPLMLVEGAIVLVTLTWTGIFMLFA
jgi:hypothetical protein